MRSIRATNRKAITTVIVSSSLCLLLLSVSGASVAIHTNEAGFVIFLVSSVWVLATILMSVYIFTKSDEGVVMHAGERSLSSPKYANVGERTLILADNMSTHVYLPEGTIRKDLVRPDLWKMSGLDLIESGFPLPWLVKEGIVKADAARKGRYKLTRVGGHTIMCMPEYEK